jgi:hypothetical protein
MKKSELKSIIKECVKEILFEEGILSNLVAEVALGITKAQALIIETKQENPPTPATTRKTQAKEEESRRRKLLETKRKMLDAMGSNKLANVFEGTEPLKSTGTPESPPGMGPMSGRDASDAGIDISGLFSVAGQKWNTLK